MKTLIVDDDRISRKKLEIILTLFGTVQGVDGGMAGVQAFREAWDQWQPFDLICMDIDMPEVNGYEALQLIREVESGRGVPNDKRVKVMMVTGMAGLDIVLFCKREGCNGFVVKPFSRDIIINKMHSMGFLLKGRAPMSNVGDNAI